MSVLFGDTGKSSVGTLRETLFTYNPVESTLVDELPLSEPTTPQITFTMDSAFITTSGHNVTYIPVPYLNLGGKNNSGVSTTIRWRVYRNGVAWGNELSKPSVTVNNFWTYFFMGWLTNLAFGDVIAIRMWADNTGVSLTYSFHMVIPTHLDFGLKLNAPVKDYSATLTRPANLQTAQAGVVTTGWTGNWYVPVGSYSLGTVGSNLDFTVPFVSNSNSSLKMGHVQGGEFNQLNGILLNTSNLPYQQQNAIPTVISFREIFY